MELNREQIIKALECCGGNNPCGEECFGHDIKGVSECTKILAQNALSLIKELTEGNERLTGELAKTYKELDEQMNFYCSFTKSKVSNCPIDDEVAKAKADTVRKMHERFIAEIEQTPNANEHFIKAWKSKIDQIAKEILEEGK